jgi:hypothetical protein
LAQGPGRFIRLRCSAIGWRTFLRFSFLAKVAIATSVFVTSHTTPAASQDMESLLTSVALNDKNAYRDLQHIADNKLPQLVNYALRRSDPFISRMARFALTRVVKDPDLTFLRASIRNGSGLEFAVSAFEVLGGIALAAEPEIIEYVAHGSDPTYRKRLAKTVGLLGIESVYRLATSSGDDLSLFAQLALANVQDQRSVQTLADVLTGKSSAMPRAWVEEALRTIVSTVDRRAKDAAPDDVLSMRRTVFFDPLPLPRLPGSGTSSRRQRLT